MTAKQFPGAFAPDGSQYITLTDGSGNLVSLSALGIETATSLALGGAAIGSNALAVTGTALISGNLQTNANFQAVNIIAAAGGIYSWTGRSALGSGSDGVIELSNNAGTDFNRLQFGGTTNSFPSLARSGTQIRVIAADASTYFDFATRTLQFGTGSVLGDSSLTTDGDLLATNSTNSSFGKLMLGGKTSSFPAIKRNGAGLAFRLADDSADAGVTSGGIISSDTLSAMSATGIPAGGTTGKGFLLSSTANYGIFFGSGTPSLSAAKGSLYLRSDGSTINNRMYVNTDGGTTWTAVTTVG